MLRGREAAGPKLRAASHLLQLLGVGGERHRVSRLERDLGLFLGHLGAPQRPRMLELIHSRRVASPSSDPPVAATIRGTSRHLYGSTATMMTPDSSTRKGDRPIAS